MINPKSGRGEIRAHFLPLDFFALWCYHIHRQLNTVPWRMERMALFS